MKEEAVIKNEVIPVDGLEKIRYWRDESDCAKLEGRKCKERQEGT